MFHRFIFLFFFLLQNYVVEETGFSSHVTRQDQHSYAKIETLRGRTPTEIHGQLKEVCGNSAVDRSTVSRWAQRFRESCRSILDVSRSDKPKITTENMSADIIATILDEDRRITAEEITLDPRYGNHRVSKSSVHRILTDVLGKRKVSLLMATSSLDVVAINFFQLIMSFSWFFSYFLPFFKLAYMLCFKFCCHC